MPKKINPHLITFYIRVCLGKSIVTSIISTKHIAHTPGVSLGTTGARDIVKNKLFSPNVALV